MITDNWVEFSDMIYIGDGDTDIPALALTRVKRRFGIVIYDSKKKPEGRSFSACGVGLNTLTAWRWRDRIRQLLSKTSTNGI